MTGGSRLISVRVLSSHGANSDKAKDMQREVKDHKPDRSFRTILLYHFIYLY
jgi:hypothetical protein